MYYALLPRTTRLTAAKYLSYSIVQYSTGWYILVYCNITEQNRTEHDVKFYTTLYYTTLYYTILYYTILYCTILYYTILYYTILYYTIFKYRRKLLYIIVLYSNSTNFNCIQHMPAHHDTPECSIATLFFI